MQKLGNALTCKKHQLKQYIKQVQSNSRSAAAPERGPA